MASSVRAGVVLAVVFSFPDSATASDAPITESDAIRLFLEQSPVARRIPSIERSVEAAHLRGALPANPEVAYQVEDAADVRDELLTIEQELPITGHRRLLRQGAVAAAAAARLAAERDLLVTVCAMRESFYEVVHRERALARWRQGEADLGRLVEILADREHEGESAGYDLLRAEQELAEIHLAASEAEAQLSAARSKFGAYFDSGVELAAAHFTGSFEPASPPPDLDEAVALALSQRHDLKALRAEVDRLELERRSARRRRFPEPVVAAGSKHTAGPGVDDTGFIASVSVPLPVFDRGQLGAAQASAERERVDLEIEILEREIHADVRIALARERVARQESLRYGEPFEKSAGELRRIAELAYDEGETGILELIDAHRSSLAIEQRALALMYEAKLAEIDRDRAMGIEVQP